MKLEDIERDVWNKGSLNREHVLAWLALQPSSQGAQLKADLKAWGQKLHDNPKFSKISFNQEPNTQGLGVSSHPLDRIAEDLQNYSRAQAQTLYELGDQK